MWVLARALDSWRREGCRGEGFPRIDRLLRREYYCTGVQAGMGMTELLADAFDQNRSLPSNCCLEPVWRRALGG